MVELALHLASGPGPQSTDAPRARGDEPQANESRCRVSLSAASHDGEGRNDDQAASALRAPARNPQALARWSPPVGHPALRLSS